MDADTFAEVLCDELNKDGVWKAYYDFPERIILTIETGETFVITVEAKDDDE